jgi:hypothetical protein
MFIIESSTPGQLCLSRIRRSTKLAQETARKSLFQALHDERGIAALRFAKQKVHMLGHDNIADDHKVIAPADPLQDLKKQVAIPRDAEQRAALVTTRGDEM